MHLNRRQKNLDMTKEYNHMVFLRKLTIRDIIKYGELEESKTKLLPNQALNTNNPRQLTKTKAASDGRFIRVETVTTGGVVHSLGEQEATSATSWEGWSQAADVLRTPVARVFREDLQ